MTDLQDTTTVTANITADVKVTNKSEEVTYIDRSTNITINRVAPPVRHHRKGGHAPLTTVPGKPTDAPAASSASPFNVEVTNDSRNGFDTTRYVEKKTGANGVVTVTGDMTVTRDASRNVATIVMHDANGQIVTRSNEEGAKGYRNVPEAYGHLTRDFSFTPGTDDSYIWKNPQVGCSSTPHDWRLNETTHNQQVDTYTEVAIRNFFDKHPGLTERVRKEDIQLTFAGGRSVNIDEIERNVPLRPGQTLEFCGPGQDTVAKGKPRF